MGEAAEICQLDDPGLLYRQLPQSAAHLACLVATEHLGIGALRCLQALAKTLVADILAGARAVSTQGVDRPMVSDPEYPVAHASARAVIANARAPQRKQRLLHHVLGERATTDHPIGQREGRVDMALHHDLERDGLVATDKLHQLLVGKLAQLRLREIDPWFGF